MDLQALWQATLGEIELTLSRANFTAWFRNTFISSIENGRVIIAVPNTFTKTWLEKKYHDAIGKALRAAFSQPIREIHYRVEMRNTTVLPLEHLTDSTDTEAPINTNEQPCPSTNAPQDEGGQRLGLNPRYTFPLFVVGKNNELAHAACMAVAARPGQTHNPLFIYGGVGMGKTHLLQAIGHQVCRDYPEAKIHYVTCERFTNEFIQALRGGTMNNFKDRYRGVDLLLIDDIQFLTGREGTQEEFFHTFNTLHQNNKQIVIASDRPPKDIQTLESRLQSRFEWGMMVDITKPDFETRVAILQAKTKDKNYSLSTELLHTVAGAIQSNIRELEGALNKIVAYHQFKNIQPSQATITPLLQSFAPTVNKKNVTPRILIDVVVTHFDISLEQILGKSREQRFSLPRQIAMYLLREETRCSFPTIGEHLGGRDHTTAMHACDKVNQLLQTDETTRQTITRIRERLYS